MPAVRKWGDELAALLERRPALIVALLVLLYLLLLVFPIRRYLWHDELFTYYIAQAPTIPAMLREIQILDLNPPMVYTVTRGWQHLFGTNETVDRIPGAVAFLIASLNFLFFLRRRMGWLWACAAVLLFWASPNFIYATELRPYALLLMFFSFTLLAWDNARDPGRRLVALAGVLLGGAGMMLCHAFAIFALGAMYLGELVRSLRRREIDWPVWIGLLLPLGLAVTYFTSTQRFQAGAFPFRFQGGPRRLAVFWAKAALGIAVPLAAALAAAFLVKRPANPNLRGRLVNVRPPDAGLWVGLALIPFLLNGLLMLTHGAFFDRYALATEAAIAVTAAVLIAAFTGFDRLAALAAAAAIAVAILWTGLVQPLARSWSQPPPSALERISPGLPLVAASGLTFLEMDHYEKPELLRRMYYLTDRPSALRYAHATIFEGMAEIAKYFPLRAKVTPYYDFVAQNRHFLVVGSMNYPEDWLLRKLSQEGAAVRQAGLLKGLPYKDFEIYDVFVPDGSEALRR